MSVSVASVSVSVSVSVGVSVTQDPSGDERKYSSRTCSLWFLLCVCGLSSRHVILFWFIISADVGIWSSEVVTATFVGTLSWALGVLLWGSSSCGVLMGFL